jgi:hypothetical protein
MIAKEGWTQRYVDAIARGRKRAWTLEPMQVSVSSSRGRCRSTRAHEGGEELGEIYIVTSPWNSNPTWTHDREEWLYRNFGIPYNRVIHTSAKYLVRGDVFIDDKASAVAKWRDAHPSGLPVLWSNLHNRTELWDGQCTGDWSFLCELVEGLAL